MIAALLLIPFFLIRFGVLYRLNQEAITRAAYYPPLRGIEKTAYWLYQISNLGIFALLFFLKIKFDKSTLFYIGWTIYIIGLILLMWSVINFATPAENGINQKGLYRFSRNPMYVAYFVFFIGCALLSKSLALLGITIIFQLTAHWIILSEERWCVATFGESYVQYMKKVRRYI